MPVSQNGNYGTKDGNMGVFCSVASLERCT
jgi:hypothetical protein